MANTRNVRRDRIGTARLIASQSIQAKGNSKWEWRSHIGLILGMVSTLFISMRLLGMAAFDVYTAYGILQWTGTAAVIVGTTVSIIGSIIPGVWFVAVVNVIYRTQGRSINIGAVIILGVLSVMVAPGFSFIILLIFLILVILDIAFLLPAGTLKTARKQARKPIMPQDFVKRTPFLFAMIIAFIPVMLSSEPPVPPESLKFSGKSLFTGYVLSSSPSMVVVLRNSPRKIEYFNSKDLTSRTICDSADKSIEWLARPLPIFEGLITAKRANYSKCPH